MPNLSDTRRDIEMFAGTNIISYPLAYDNIPFDDASVQEYAHISISFTDTKNVNVGGITSKRVRHEGDIVFKLYTAINSGTQASFVMADYIKDLFQNKYISSNLLTYAARPMRQGVGKEGFFTYFIRIPFISDEC